MGFKVLVWENCSGNSSSFFSEKTKLKRVSGVGKEASAANLAISALRL